MSQANIVQSPLHDGGLFICFCRCARRHEMFLALGDYVDMSGRRKYQPDPKQLTRLPKIHCQYMYYFLVICIISDTISKSLDDVKGS